MKKLKLDETGDSDDLQALFDSIASETPQKVRLEVVPEAVNSVGGDSADLEALFDTVSTEYTTSHAVDESHEGKGIGGALMRAALLEARKRGHGAVLLVGDAPYYERFGFFADKTQHLVMPGPFARDRFLALELVHGWLEGAAGMVVASGRKLSQPQAFRRAA